MIPDRKIDPYANVDVRGKLVLAHGPRTLPRGVDVQQIGRITVGAEAPVAAAAARHRILVDAPAQGAVVELGFRRLAGGVEQGDHVLAGKRPRLGGFRGGGDLFVAEALEAVAAVDHDRGIVHFGQHVLAELGSELGHLGIDLADARLLRVGQRGAGAHEILVTLFQQAPVDSRGGAEAFQDEWAEYGWELTAHKPLSLEATNAWRRAEGELVWRRPHYEERYGKRSYLAQLDLLTHMVQTYERGEVGHGLYVFRRR